MTDIELLRLAVQSKEHLQYLCAEWSENTLVYQLASQLLKAGELLGAERQRADDAIKLNPMGVNVSELEATYIGDIRLHMKAISEREQRSECTEPALLGVQEPVVGTETDIGIDYPSGFFSDGVGEMVKDGD